MVKWKDGKVDECCEFFLVRLLQLIHKSFPSSLTLLSIFGGAGASRRVGRSWGIALSPLCFTPLQFSLVSGPSGTLHHSRGHEVLKGFSSDGDITHRITSVNTGFRSYWQESSFSEELTSCLAIKFQHHFLGFFPSISVEGKVSNGLWRGQQIRWLATGSFICCPQSLFVDQVNLFFIICLFFYFKQVKWCVILIYLAKPNLCDLQ